MITHSIVKKSELEGTKRCDAEFYQPKYLKVRHAIIEFEHVEIGKIVDRCKKGIFDIKAERYEYSGIPFLRISNLKDGLIDNTDMVFIPPDIHQKEIKTEFHRNDIVLSKTAYPAAAIVFFEKCNISQDIIGISLKNLWKTKLHAPYIVTFLNSKYGLLEMQQWFQGNIQMHLALPDVKRIIIPILSQKIQQKISELYSNAQEQIKKSKSLYTQSENLLLNELGLNNFDFSQPNSFSIPLSQAQEAHRIDAEHYQPKYDKLIQHLAKTGKTKLHGEIATYIKRGLQPTYVEDGEIIVVNSQHLGRCLINVEATERTDHDFWERNTKARLEKDDILVYSTGAYVGRTNVWLENQKGIASNHVTIVRNLKGCDPLYLAVYLNALPGLLQAEKWATGSGQRELYSEPIANFYIYLPSEGFQTKIANLVTQSYQARKKAKSLLEEAKKKVEDFIVKKGLELKEEVRHKVFV